MDETERANVFKLKSFDEMRKKELEMEKHKITQSGTSEVTHSFIMIVKHVDKLLRNKVYLTMQSRDLDVKYSLSLIVKYPVHCCTATMVVYYTVSVLSCVRCVRCVHCPRFVRSEYNGNLLVYDCLIYLKEMFCYEYSMSIYLKLHFDPASRV